MILSPLQIIEIHNMGPALLNKTYLIEYYARANWQWFTKKSSHFRFLYVTGWITNISAWSLSDELSQDNRGSYFVVFCSGFGNGQF